MSPLWPLAHIQGRLSGATHQNDAADNHAVLHVIVVVAPLGYRDGRYGALEIGRPIQSPMLLWPKLLDLCLERGFDRPVRRLNSDHARPGIGDTASLADTLDLRTLLREFASAQN
jgi:hypothetical protein